VEELVAAAGKHVAAAGARNANGIKVTIKCAFDRRQSRGLRAPAFATQRASKADWPRLSGTFHAITAAFHALPAVLYPLGLPCSCSLCGGVEVGHRRRRVWHLPQPVRGVLPQLQAARRRLPAAVGRLQYVLPPWALRRAIHMRRTAFGSRTSPPCRRPLLTVTCPPRCRPRLPPALHRDVADCPARQGGEGVPPVPAAVGGAVTPCRRRARRQAVAVGARLDVGIEGQPRMRNAGLAAAAAAA
jgi:hypothetical protein